MHRQYYNKIMKTDRSNNSALLEKVSFGQLVSYGELSTMVTGKPRAARAVGQAMRSNPIPLLIPCHRVVRADGTLGHYDSGKKDHACEAMVD